MTLENTLLTKAFQRLDFSQVNDKQVPIVRAVFNRLVTDIHADRANQSKINVSTRTVNSKWKAS